MTDFDPAQHRMVPEQRWFEDFVLGERFVIPSRTQTSAVFAAFQTASGDTHPIHYDVEYCHARGMPDLLAHGFQTLVHTAPGSGLFPYLVEESMIGFLEQSSKFLKPVYAGDTIYPALEVTELRRCHRHVLDAHRVQPRRHFGLRDDLRQLVVEPLDDGRRRAGRREDRLPRGHVEALQAGLGERGHIGQHLGAFRGGDGERANLAAG